VRHISFFDGYFLLMFNKVMQRRFDIFSTKPAFHWSASVHWPCKGQWEIKKAAKKFAAREKPNCFCF